MKRYYVFRTGEAGDTFDADYEPDALGKWVKFEDAQAEIDRRDARVAQLEAAQKEGHAALTQQIAENAELKRKLANHAARLGTALKTRSELLGKLRERDTRIVALEAEMEDWLHSNKMDEVQRELVQLREIVFQSQNASIDLAQEIQTLQAEAGVDKALLALADARLNREVLKTKGGV